MISLLAAEMMISLRIHTLIDSLPSGRSIKKLEYWFASSASDDSYPTPIKYKFEARLRQSLFLPAIYIFEAHIRMQTFRFLLMPPYLISHYLRFFVQHALPAKMRDCLCLYMF